MQLRNLKRALYAAMVAAPLAMLQATPGQAATANTTISIDFPSILILYTYDNIELEVSEAGLGGALEGSGTVSCTGSDCRSAQGDRDLTGSLLSLDGADVVDATIGTPVGSLPSGIGVTIENAYGARCLGCSAGTYAVTLTDGGNSAAIGTFTTTAPAVNGLTLATGDLSFEVDLGSLTAAGAVSETVTITVVGP